DLHRTQELVAVERNAPAVALDHGELAQLHALESREAEIAGEADAAAADDRAVFGRPRVLDLRVQAGAIRTAHVRFYPLVSSWPGLSRPSTSSLSRERKDVDARPKAGHDGCDVVPWFMRCKSETARPAP